jgi:hypothetical protein
VLLLRYSDKFAVAFLNHSSNKIIMGLSILNGILCVSFILFAYVNLNDGDSWLWVPIYLVAAICCGLAVFKFFYPTIYLVAMAFYLIYAIKLFFTKDGVRDWIVVYRRPSIVETMQATKPYIEKTREFFGLLIITAALAINYFTAK